MQRRIGPRSLVGLVLLVMSIVASSCGGSTTSAGAGETTASSAAAVEDGPDAERAAMVDARERCLQDLVAARPELDELFRSASTAGGSANLPKDDQIEINDHIIGCSPPQLVSLLLGDVDQPWLGKEQLDCLATSIKGSETQGLAYLGLLHLMSGRLEPPVFRAEAIDPAIVGASACVSPSLPILGESVAGLLADPRTEAAVDVACYDAVFADPAETVGYWLARYRRVVLGEEDDESMRIALEGSTLRCLDHGILLQASLWKEKGIEISTQTTACVSAGLQGTDFVRLRALEDPGSEDLVSTALDGCLTEAERKQFD